MTAQLKFHALYIGEISSRTFEALAFDIRSSVAKWLSW